jgi:CBS domain-containing protein
VSGAPAGTSAGERPTEGGARPAGRATLGMFSPLSAFLVAAPATVPLETTIRAALEVMAGCDVGSIVVTDAGGRVPLGMFTLQDLVRRVTLPGGDLEQPVASVMTGGLITLPPQATAHHAALTMARNGVRRVVVVEADGRLAGVVSQTDLFGLQQVGVEQVNAALGAARDVEGLQAAAAGIRRLTEALLAQGVGVEAISQATSTMNDLLTIRVIELAADEHDLPPVPFCWIALGSEGRLEQTFATDQDNGIIFDADEADAERVREGLLPFARAVNERLDACGFALCKGQIMASNPRWCLSLDEWRRTFSRWIHVPEPEALLNAAIFFDLRPIHGSAALAERLRASLLAETADRPIFLRVMTENALGCRPPLGTLRDFVTDRSKEFRHTLDLKMNGSRPFVDAARILALAHGVAHTSTAERLRAVEEVVHQGPEALAAIVDGFHVVHRFRLLSQCGARPGPAPNRLDPDTLHDLDRHVLKEAFHQARRLQERLARAYDLA